MRNSRRLVAVDCETDPAKYGRVPKPFLWGAYDGTNYLLFRSTADFVAWIVTQNCVAYAHNGGKFDFIYLLPFIKETKAQVINGRIVKMNLGKAELRDSFAAIPAALKVFGGKLDIDYSKLELEVRDENMPEIEAYLKQDCVALYDLMLEYRNIAGKKTTIASNAYAFAKKIGINPGRTNHTFDKNLREFYFGGRCEVFQPGTHADVRIIDIHSAYPYAMTFDHACGAEWRHIKEQEFKRYSREKQQRCFIELECYSDGAFPKRIGVELMFPRAKNIYKVTGWEYVAAVELGLISEVKIIDIISLPVTINFTPYVKHWYEYKEAHPKKIFPIKYEIGKRMMNAYYGKLAQNVARYYDYKIVEAGTQICYEYEHTPDFICANCGEKDNAHGWNVYIEYEGTEIHRRPALWKYIHKFGKAWEGQPAYNNVATGASITGFTRAHLLRAIHAVGLQHVIYSDTDSIICYANADLTKLSRTEKLGDWGDDGTGSIGHFVGKKVYGIQLHEIDKDTGKPAVKIASKGSKLIFGDIEWLALGKCTDPKRHLIKDGERIVVWRSDFPSFSIAGEADFVVRNIRQTAKAIPPSRFSLA